MSACFSLTVGVRQGGVLSPLLFTVYINSLLLRLQQSNYGIGCVIASQFLAVLCMLMILCYYARAFVALRKCWIFVWMKLLVYT